MEKLTSETFESFTECSGVVLVLFTADWCGPCQMFKPILLELDKERKDIKVGMVNIDDAPELAAQYGVSAIPTLAYFKNGSMVNCVVGQQSRSKVLETIASS